MSNNVCDNLTREKIQQLLSAVGSNPKDESSQIDAVELNWSEPHYFNSEQLEKIELFIQNLTSTIAKKFTDFCRGQFEVTIVSTKQYFTDDFINRSADDGNQYYYLPFDNENGQRTGILGMTEKTASLWTKQLLGDTDPKENEQKELSQLEKSLLSDLACAVVRAFSQSHSSFNFSPANNLVYKQWPLDSHSTQELFQISFSVKQTDEKNDTQAFFLVPCSSLNAVVGMAKKTGPELSRENISQIILEHLGQTSVCVTAQLGRTELSFEEIMELQVNDILLLDKKVDEFVELFVDERKVCSGWPVQSDGRYAIAIAETAFGDTA
jgi:flagellar motor switch protein FliM